MPSGQGKKGHPSSGWLSLKGSLPKKEELGTTGQLGNGMLFHVTAFWSEVGRREYDGIHAQTALGCPNYLCEPRRPKTVTDLSPK